MIQLNQPVFINRILMQLTGDHYNYRINGSDRDPSHFFQIRDENIRDNCFEHLLINFLEIRGSTQHLNELEFKCSDLCCP